jgi:hypothetical protein
MVRITGIGVAAAFILLIAGHNRAAAPVAQDAKATAQPSSMKELRRQAAQKRRRIVFNDDGGQTQKRMTEPTAKNLIDQGTGALAGTNVDTLVYCTKSVGLDLFTHFTKVGTIFTSRDGPFANNQVAALFEQGIDPLRVVIDFGKQNEMEVFWSMRMNDNHDAAKADYGLASLRANRFKADHPEFMLGTPTKKPKHGAWTALDFGRAEVRERAFRLVEEVCRNYDVDGIELDFFRHPVYFRSNASGKPATDEDRAAMTELVTRIRTMADEVGQLRGRPILIGMRLPDSVEYCRAIGLDLERWMVDDLLDIYVPGSYYQINEWDYSVALGHKYGIKVYASLDDMRSRDPAALAMRVTNRVYRARAADAWRAGADGVYLFNYPDVFLPDEAILHELGNPQALAKLDKDYFGSYRGAMNASGGNLPFQPFLKLETLNPDSTREIKPGATATAKLYLAEDGSSKTPPTLKLRLQLRGVEEASQLQVALNGRPLKRSSSDGDWFAWAPNFADLKSGPNTVEVALPASAKAPATWSDVVLEVRH